MCGGSILSCCPRNPHGHEQALRKSGYKVNLLQYFPISKGVGRKLSREGVQRKKDRIAKNTEKIALFSLFEGGANGKKDPKNSKKRRKVALLSLYLLYLYHV